MRILLIEDDAVLSSVLAQSLTSQRYIVDIAEDGQMGWRYAQSMSYDLILMDIGLPKLEGIELCQRLRADGCSTPILLMTAKDASNERIRGLDAGADDYLIKPLDLKELQARVRALLRRGELPHSPVLEIGNLRLDPSCCQVTYGEKFLALTPKEYSLLELLMRNPARVFSRGQMVEHLWTFDDPPQEESVKAHIKGLRQKLKAAGVVDWIENVYGLGYRLQPKIAENNPLTELAPSQDQASDHSNSVSPTLNSQRSTPATVEQQFTQAVDSLWVQYQELMAQRLEVLQQAAVAVHSEGLSEELRQSAERAAHKLAGVLGMFDREAGTLLAREIEQILQGNDNLLPTQASKLVSRVQALSDLLNLQTLEEPAALPNPAQLLLISPESQLGSALQQLALPMGMGWTQVTTLAEAKTWLQTRSPDLVVLSLDEVEQRQAGLALLRDLAARTPPVPGLALAPADGLVDRVTVARAGGRGFLVKPVTATQIWEAACQLLHQARAEVVNVLVVDDDPLFLAALKPILEPWGIRMTGLDDPLCFWDTLQSVAPDLLILDVEMPQLGGIELSQAVRTDPAWQGLPILFLTAHCEAETIQQVFAAGADDYVTKPIVGPELLTRITNRLERTRLLENLSSRDPLTGMPNQLHSSRDLEVMIGMAERDRSPFCLALLSATQLHQINTQYGHTAGNQVLQRWGHLFHTAFRSTERLGYWGYGEFIVGMLGLTKVEAGDRLSQVLTTLRQQIFSAADGTRFQVTCTSAIAEYPADGLTLQSLYQAASLALEAATT
jgi:diguanylate cyclase (GGDEF)-like protein